MEMEPQGRDLAFLYSDNKLTDQKELLERWLLTAPVSLLFNEYTEKASTAKEGENKVVLSQLEMERTHLMVNELPAHPHVKVKLQEHKGSGESSHQAQHGATAPSL